MSYQILKKDILFYQRFLQSTGFYKGLLDGYWGPVTAKADTGFLKESDKIAKNLGTFDTRSEGEIITLIPRAQKEARKFLKLALEHSKGVRIISGTRTYSEQDAIYAQGRNGKKGPIVTNAKGGQSNHNFGIAWDIGVFNKNGYVTSEGPYRELGEMIMPQLINLEWGGHWKTFKDVPHYQLKAVSNSVAAIRKLFEKGEVYV